MSLSWPYGRRKLFPGFLEAMFVALPTPTDVTTKDFYATTSDGHQLLLRWITKTSTENPTTPTSAVVYTHGGGEQRILFTPMRPLRYLFSTGLTVMSLPSPKTGMIMADVDVYKPLLMGQVSQSGIPLLAVDYRLAPEVLAFTNSLCPLLPSPLPCSPLFPSPSFVHS
jgi:acetyl esterase/lipase